LSLNVTQSNPALPNSSGVEEVVAQVFREPPFVENWSLTRALSRLFSKLMERGEGGSNGIFGNATTPVLIILALLLSLLLAHLVYTALVFWRALRSGPGDATEREKSLSHVFMQRKRRPYGQATKAMMDVALRKLMVRLPTSMPVSKWRASHHTLHQSDKWKQLVVLHEYEEFSGHGLRDDERMRAEALRRELLEDGR